MTLPTKSMESNLGLEVSVEASKHSKHFVETSKSYSAKYENALPKLASSEIEIGELLGSGGFCDVHEITSFRLLETNDKEEEDKDQRTSREFLKTHVNREKTGDCRYAVKYLRHNVVKDGRLFRMAAVDLAIEAKVLCSVFHPNIIKLRGICSEGEMGFQNRNPEGFFLVLDRLYDTLEERIAWWKFQEMKTKKKKPKGFQLKRMFGANKLMTDNIYISNDKLKIILDISEAFKYLHKRNIIYRDIKPENFGFDVRGDIKVFDFGLSKEMSSCQIVQDGTYHLTGGIGSPRYMAPEVVKHETYNLSADVYSFSIMIWEMLTLEKSFEGFTREKHAELVAYGTHRPKISKSFPLQLQALMEDGWSSNLHDRPSFEWISIIFSDMVSSQDGTSGLAKNSSRRRSSFLMLRSSLTNDLTGSATKCSA